MRPVSSAVHPGDSRRGRGRLVEHLPELVDNAGRGARFDLRAVKFESGLVLREMSSNESQEERFVMAIAPESLAQFEAFASASAARLR